MRDLKKHISKKIVDIMTNYINESRKEWLLRAFMKAGEKLKRISKYKVWQDGNQPKQLLPNTFMTQNLIIFTIILWKQKLLNRMIPHALLLCYKRALARSAFKPE